MQLPDIELLQRVHSGPSVIARLRKQPVQARRQRKFWRVWWRIQGCQSKPAVSFDKNTNGQASAAWSCLLWVLQSWQQQSRALPPAGILCLPGTGCTDCEPLACLSSGGSKVS